MSHAEMLELRYKIFDSVTHLIRGFVIIQNKFRAIITHIYDNHIKFTFLYIFGGSGLLCGIRIYLAKNELPHAREKLMAHFLFAN